MTNPRILKLITAKDSASFTARLADSLKLAGISAYTIWHVENSAICSSIHSTEGVTDTILDIYDLGYNGETLLMDETTLFLRDRQLISYASLFCVDNDNLVLAVTFHQPVTDLLWLSGAAGYIAQRYNELRAEERRFDIFVDYQKKIDFVKDSGQILKALSVDEVMMQALDVFIETFQAEAGCAIKDDFFAGIGISEDDIENEIFVDDKSTAGFIKNNTDTLYLTSGLRSSKFNAQNLFVIHDNDSGAVFILFNIAGELVPDKEMSALITHIVSLAVENAIYHEKETALKIEQAEVSQTVEIIKRFVHQEASFHNGDIQGCSVNHPARSTGGDFATVRKDNDNIFACVADVCGKGYAAATLTIMLATIIDTGLESYSGLDDLTNTINDYMLEKGFDARFITGFFCRYNPAAKLLRYTNCGHEPTFLFRDGKVIELHTKNFPLGIMPEKYIVEETEIEKGDLLFIYTDGLLEYAPHDELQKRILDIKDLPITDIVDKLYADLVTDPLSQIDDFTCALIKF